MNETQTLFIHAWWRSGSTYSWSKLRENESCTCYYEPLHEQLAKLAPETIGASPEIERSKFLRHPVQTKNYFAEYAELLRARNLKFFPQLSYDRYLLLPDQEDELLRAYIENLIESSRAKQTRPVLCFCRSQMRSAWIKTAFAGAHICQIRNPFDQWTSFNVQPYFAIGALWIALKLRASHPSAFAHIESFERFAEYASKVPLPVGQIYSSFLKEYDLVAVFMVLWLASALQAISYSDFALDIDRLSVDVESRNEAMAWFQSIGCRVDFSDCAIPISKERSGEAEKALDLAIEAIRSNASSLVVALPEEARRKVAALSIENAEILLRVLNK